MKTNKHTRTIYATVRIDPVSDNEISDEQVETFIENCMYSFPSTEETEVLDTTWENTDY